MTDGIVIMRRVITSGESEMRMSHASRSGKAAAFCLALLSTAVMASPASGASWPVYGKDLANSRSGGHDSPSAREVGSLTQQWRFSDPDGDFTGTPVVGGGLLVAGSFAGHVHALDAVTGEERWMADVGGPINGSAAIDPLAPGGGAVYVPVAIQDSPRLVALSLADGSQLWSTVLTDQDGSSVYGSPTYWRGSIYIGTSGPNGDDSSARGSVVAIDAQSGAVRWQTFTVPPGYDGGPVWSTAALDTATGRLYVGTGNAYHGEAAETTDAILALDARSGMILGHYAATPDDTFSPDSPLGPDYDFGASPNLIRGPSGSRLVGEGAKSGIYWAVKRSTLQPVWNDLTGPGGAVGGIIGSTAYDGIRIYGNNALNGDVWALGRDGKRAWTVAGSGPANFAPVAVANGVVYTVDPAGSLLARDAQTGERLNRLSLGDASFGGVSIVGGAVYVSVGIGPAPDPAPQQAGAGSIIAFGDTSRSTAAETSQPVQQGATETADRIKLRIRPRRVEAGDRVRFRFRAMAFGEPLEQAKIRLSGRTTVTNAQGRARLRMRLTRGRHWARARHRGYIRDRAEVRARPVRR